MTGLLILIALIAAVLIGLRLLGVRGGLHTAGAAAMLFGAAAYSLQGEPGLAGSPAQSNPASATIDLAPARHAFFGNFSSAENWLRISDALARRGNSEDAVNILQNAVRRYPGDAQLWVGLGNALVEHAHGLTPPAEFAFQRAAAVAPGYPGPQFFYGLALARSGDRAGAIAAWKALLEQAPSDASWRALVERGMAAVNEPVRR